MESATRLSPVDSYLGIGEHRLKDQFYLSPLPLFRERKLVFVIAFLVGYAFRLSLSIEAHTILIGAEALQLPTRRDANLRPLAGILPISTLEIPLHHVVTTVTRKVLPLRFHNRLSQRKSAKPY